jgi:ABC-2 type transport system ATP-binding protein
MTDVLSVAGAKKRFGSTEALVGADLALRRGEWLALLGPNGAGKTTLVRSIAGRVRLDAGTLTLLDRALDGSADAEAARRRLGVVPQEIALYPLLTARENLAAFGALHGIPTSDLAKRVEWALAWTGLADRAREPVKRFSGGMKRRLNIACGVLHEPEVILLDEPTVGVDPQSRERIWEMLRALQRDGASLLLTTHQLDEAQQICERIVIIDHGRAVAAGTFDELLTQTIGRERRVTFVLDGDTPAALEGLGFTIGSEGVERRVNDVAAELSGHLDVIATNGGRVSDVRIEAPSLQAVFIHLTGHELRE